MRIEQPLPECLTRIGITSAHDNLQDGQIVDGLATEIVRLYGKELMARFTELQQRAKADPH